MKELYLKIVCDVRKFSFFPVFTQDDIPKNMICRFVPLASAVMQNDEGTFLFCVFSETYRNDH